MDREQILVGLASSVAGGLLVAVVNILFTRRKTSLEAQKLELEIEKLRAEAGKLQGDFDRLNATVRESAERAPAYRITFDGDDWNSPEAHGWRVSERASEGEPELTPIKDGFWGRVLQVRRRRRYALDYALNPSTGTGSAIEYVLKLEENEDARVYAQVVVQSRDSSQSEKLWLAFERGAGRPRERYGINPRGVEWEWTVPVVGKRLEDRWEEFRVDLREVVSRCLKDKGWQYGGQILTFRLRGSLSIAYISIFD